MPFQQQEDLGGVGQDRQLSVLTTANIGGAAVMALLAWQGTGMIGLTGPWFSARWWMQTIIIVGGVVLGVVLTMRWSGLSLLDRIQLRIGYQMRRLAGEHVLAPEAPASSPRQRGLTALYRNGRVVARPYTPSREDA